MCPCTPSDNTLNPTVFPGIPGLFSPFQIPLPSFDLPKDLLEDFTALLKLLGTILPFGFSTNPDLGMKSIMDFIANLLTQIAPFLSFWNFIMALLKMIICIIEVLCALPDPFAVAAALATLFSECLPPFLNLFPFLALIAMIIALILLIIALILYIIETIILIIEEIILNLIVLADGITLQDVDSVLAAAAKIANLLCFIQNILAILIAIAAILAIIQALALIGGVMPCGPDSSTCCTVCPAFIKDNPDGIPVTNGRLTYFPQVGVDLASILGISDPDQAALIQVPPIREERWQLNCFDEFVQYPINSIITPIEINNPKLITDGSPPPVESGIFWPDPLEFESDFKAKVAPYTAEIFVTMDPKVFHPSDTKGRRTFTIKHCIVVRKPYDGILTYNNILDLSNTQGTLNIEGGAVFDADGYNYKVDGYNATINTFLHKDVPPASAIPSSDDGVVFDVSFIWKPNAPSIAGMGLIPFSCVPTVSLPKAVVSAAFAAENPAAVIDKLPVISPAGFLPDVLGAQQCVSNALAEFRKDVSNAGAAKFQAAMQACMDSLTDQCNQTICNCINAGASPFKSTVALDTNVQFTTRPINVNVILKDASGTSISSNIPKSCNIDILGHVTFGEITPFVYDGYTSFNAQITSDTAGVGELTIEFNGKILSQIVNSGTVSAAIEELATEYQFIESVIIPPVRRDATDVAGTNTA